MTTHSTSREDAGGTGLLVVVSFATIFIVALEAVFITYATWWMLPLMLLAVILMAIVVIGAVMRTIGDDSPTPVPKPRENVEPQPAAAPARPLPRVVAGH